LTKRRWRKAGFHAIDCRLLLCQQKNKDVEEVEGQGMGKELLLAAAARESTTATARRRASAAARVWEEEREGMREERKNSDLLTVSAVVSQMAHLHFPMASTVGGIPPESLSVGHHKRHGLDGDVGLRLCSLLSMSNHPRSRVPS